MRTNATTRRTNRDRLASRMRTLATLATPHDAPETAAVVVAFTREAITRRVAARIGATDPDTDRQDYAQVAAARALAMYASGTPLPDACRIATFSTLNDKAADNADAGRTPTYGTATDLARMIDSTDPRDEKPTVCAWQPPAPDACTRITIHDTASTVVGLLDPAATAALTTARRMPADTDGRAWRSNRLTGTALAHAQGKTSRKAATARNELLAAAYDEATATVPRVLAWMQHTGPRRTWDDAATVAARLAAHEARTTSTKRNRQPVRPIGTPDTGPASLPVLTDRHGRTWLLLADRSSLIPAEHAATVTAAALAARIDPTRPDEATRAADALAYLMTPGAPVAPKPSARKRSRDGAVGSPTITRGPRQDWRTTTTKRDADPIDAPARWEALTTAYAPRRTPTLPNPQRPTADPAERAAAVATLTPADRRTTTRTDQESQRATTTARPSLAVTRISPPAAWLTASAGATLTLTPATCTA